MLYVELYIVGNVTVKVADNVLMEDITQVTKLKYYRLSKQNAKLKVK